MNFTVESRYPLSIFNDNNVAIDWDTIKVGWDLQRITPDEISKFAVDYLEQHPSLVNEYVSELIFGVKDYEIGTYLQNVFKSLGMGTPEKNSIRWNIQWRKWRYCIMSEMVKNISNSADLLQAIEGVYADFGYPEDMNGFIYYIPIDQRITENTIDTLDGHEKLMKVLNTFLVDEKRKIDQNDGVLPFRGID